jgi:hypothetical protein
MEYLKEKGEELYCKFDRTGVERDWEEIWMILDEIFEEERRRSIGSSIG